MEVKANGIFNSCEHDDSWILKHMQHLKWQSSLPIVLLQTSFSLIIFFSTNYLIN